MDILSQIKNEVNNYLTQSVQTSSGESYSEWKIKKRIAIYKNRHYPTGKVNAAGEIEYWFDRISTCVNNEVKNLRLDSKYFMFWSKNAVGDFAAVFIMNTKLVEFMETTGRAEELSESNEDFSADGNLLLRKTDKDYEKCDPMNTFLTNTLARSVNQTAIVERFYLTQSELRQKEGLYKNVDNVIEKCGNTQLSPTADFTASPSTKTYPLYEIYRRTGEVSEKTLFKAQGKEGGDEKKFVLARIIVAGLSKEGDGKDEYVLFAEELTGKMSDHFKEAHRGPYKGKWWREGLYEILFDQQTAYNELTNEIMRAIPWNTSAIFRASDISTFQSLRQSLVRGSLLKSADLSQVQVNARTVEAINMRNTIIAEMDSLANSYEVVRGVTPASGTPLGTSQLANDNATKLFDFLRKKLAVPYRYVYREFVLPNFVKHLKGEDIIRITGSEQVLDSFRRLAARMWFNSNLALIGPHTPDMREALIEEKVLEMQAKDPVIKNSKAIWKEITPRLYVTIVGENYNSTEQEVAMQMIPMETDPIRRAFLLDFIYASRGIPVPPPVSQLPQQQLNTGTGSKTQNQPTKETEDTEEPATVWSKKPIKPLSR